LRIASPDNNNYNQSFTEAQTLSPTSHLMHLSAHLFLQHGAAKGRLIWLYDLHLLLRKYRQEIDWDVLIAQSRQLKWCALMEAALSQLQNTFQTEIPPNILETIKEHQNTLGQKWVTYKNKPNQSRAWAQWQKWVSLTWCGKLVYGLGNLLPSPAFMRRRYEPKPEWLWPFYYLYRWGDIAVEIGKTLKRTIFKR